MKFYHGIPLLLFTLISLSLTAQFDGNHPPNTFRSKDNPWYWQNKLPRADYWQQDVYYKIGATIDDSLNIIDGHSFELTYWNNSPDKLSEVYFHLYQNAFQPGSYMHNLYLNNDKEITFGEYESQKLGTTYENLRVNGQIAACQLDNTILKVDLPVPLKPGDSAVFSMSFKTYFDQGTFRRRMKMFEEEGYKHYDGVHWYPSMAVYDQKFGWTTEQHMDKEFYADFGTFEVELEFPNDYIVGATGTLQNEEEVLPKALREQLDISNFEKKPTTLSTPIIRDNNSPKTWKFYAENVHNFAFTADPSYRIGEIPWGNDKKVVTLAREQNAHKWQQSGAYTKQVVEIYNQDFGEYAWPKIIIADANDGMEYPMLTLDNGGYPGHQGLLSHEVGHMWFYGMIGSNETYRAMMDEGFTQFLTVWSMDKIIGEEIDYKTQITEDTKNNYRLKHLNPKRNRYERLYFPYLRQVHRGYDHPLNTHSSDFNGAVRHGGGYGLVYYKTGVMLYNLKYVLGDELFLKAMQYYFNKWSIAHPYTDDFRRSIIEFTKVDLNWFFDQWMETTKHIDYGIEKVYAGENENEYKIEFKRIGEMQMPIDFTVITKNGDRLNYHIPNTWFIKEVDAQVLPKWYGWGNINPTYTATVKIDAGIDNVIIDTSFLLADINQTNNRWNGAYQFQFDHRVYNYPDWYQSENFYRPDIWYNGFDGIQIGAHIEGNYFRETNFYAASVWYNTGLLQQLKNDRQDYRKLSVHLYSKETLRKYWRNFYISQSLKINNGLFKGGIELEKTYKPNDIYNKQFTRFTAGLHFMIRPDSSDLNYLIHDNLWSVGQYNNTFKLAMLRHYVYDLGQGDVTIKAVSPGLFSDFNYSYVELEAINNNELGSSFQLRTRVFARVGQPSTPMESALYLAGANPSEMYDNKFMRARGFFPVDFGGFGSGVNHLQYGGGLNLRGYAGYLAPDGKSTISDSLTYNGHSGASASFELGTSNSLIHSKKVKKFFRVHPYLFTDIGVISYQSTTDNYALGNLRMDAGIGSTWTIRFGRLDIPPFTLRTDFPLFLNRPPFEDDGYVKFRYVIGIAQSF